MLYKPAESRKGMKIYSHWTNLSKADQFDKSQITTTTTTTSSLRPLPQYLLAVKNSWPLHSLFSDILSDTLGNKSCYDIASNLIPDEYKKCLGNQLF